MLFTYKDINFIKGGVKKPKASFGWWEVRGGNGLSGHLHPSFYSTQLKLPNNHSPIILTVTKIKKITILTMKPELHMTIGVMDIIINSKSKIKKIIQKIKKRNETGNTLTLNESKPHSNVSAFIDLLIRSKLKIPIILGTIKAINIYVKNNHI